MAKIPLEDNFTDIIGKAQRGLKLSDEQLCQKSGIELPQLQAVKSGAVNEQALRKIAKQLNLDPDRLIVSARQGWYPNAHEVAGLAQFNTQYHDMTVNAYLVWDEKTKEAAAFDTGADA